MVGTIGFVQLAAEYRFNQTAEFRRFGARSIWCLVVALALAFILPPSVAAQAIAPPVPEAPRMFAVAAGHGKATLTWRAPATRGGLAIDRYEYRHAAGAAVSEEVGWTSVGRALTVTLRGLTNGTGYAFEVRAVNAAGEGAAAMGTATPGTVAEAPRHLSTTPGDGRVALTWQAPANADTSAIESYQYRYAAGASVPETAAWRSAGGALGYTVGGLVNGTDYTFEVRALSAVGAGEAAAVTAAPVAQETVPTAPRELSAAPRDGRIVLDWDVPASDGGATVRDYEYRYAAGASVPGNTAWQSAGTALTVTIGNLTNGTGYAFEVRASNDNGEGAAARIAATPGAVPGLPQGLAAVTGDGEVSLTWQPPSDAGGSAIVDYQIRYGEGAAAPVDATWRSTGQRTSYTRDRLSNGTAYTFEVRAVSAIGAGDSVEVTATPATAPGAPQRLTAAPGNQKVTLRWQAPADDGGLAVTRYEYRHDEGASVSAETGWTPAGVTLTATIGNLTDGTAYAFEVRAVNDIDAGEPAAATATLTGAPSAPQRFSATPGDGEVTLTWAAPAEPGSAAIDRYEYRHAQATAVPPATAWTDAGTALTATVDSLANETVHAFEVRAVSAAGEGAIAAATATPVPHPTVTVRPLQAAYRFAEGASGSVVAIVAEVERGRARPDAAFVVSVSTSAVTGGATFPDDVETLAVDITIDPADFSEISGLLTANKTVALAIVNDSAAEADEEFQVQVALPAGSPDWLQLRQADGMTDCAFDRCAVTVTIEDNDNPPSAPQNLVATPGDGEVTVAWEAPASDGGSSIQGYQIRAAAGASVPSATPWIPTGSDTSRTFRQLTDGTLYSFEVRAVNAGGAGPAALAQATPGAPTAPQDVTTTVEDGGVVLEWSAPADDYGSAIGRYEMRSAAGASIPESTPWVSTGTRTSGAFRQLPNGTLHSFEVRAVNARGAGAAARVRATPGLRPSAPRNLTATPGDRKVTLQWEEPADSGSAAITDYEYRYAAGATVPADIEWRSNGDRLLRTVRSLDVGVTYAFEVRAVTAVGAGDAAAAIAAPAAHPAIAVRPEQAAYSFPESAGGPVVAVVAEGEPGFGRPGTEFYMSASTRPVEDGARSPEDYGALSVQIKFSPDDFTAAGGIWRARKTVALAIVDDLLDEEDEDLTVVLEQTAGTPSWVRFREPKMTVMIEDNDRAASAPQNLAATPGDERVTLEWEAPADSGTSPITRYEYRYGEGASLPEATKNTVWISTGTALTVAVDSLAEATVYAFEVRAFSDAGGGKPASVTGSPSGAPSVPQDVAATTEDGGVVLEWSPPASDGGSDITRYEMRHAAGDSVPESAAWTSTGTDTTGAFRGLTNATLYSFEVRAVNANGNGPAAQIQATPGLRPSVPQNLTATPGHGQVVLEWDAPADRGSTAITRYEYRYAAGATVPSGTAWAEDERTDRLVIVEDLTNGTAYAFEVRAVNASGAGEAAAITATPVRHPTVTVRPEQATYRFTEGASGTDVAIVAQVEQGASRPSESFGVSVAYLFVTGGATFAADVEARDTWIDIVPGDYSEVGGIWQARKTVAFAIVDDSAVEDDEEFQLKFAGAPGNPPWVDFRESDGTTACALDGCVMTVTIEDNDGAPAAPQDVVATPEDGGVVLEWSPPANSGGSSIARYEMRSAAGASVPETTPWISTGTRTSGAFRQLTNGTLHSFEVRAVNAQGAGPAAQIQATPGFTPSAPQNLSATPGDGQVTLRWDAPADSGSTAIERYEYRYAEGDSVPDTTDWISAGTALTVTVDGLDHGAEYAFEVRAVNAVGPGAAVAATAMLAATEPGAPQSLEATPGDGSVVLVWTAPADDGGSPVTEYEYRHAPGSSVPDTTDWTSAGTALTVTVDGLDNGAEYAFEVRAVTSAGPGAAVAATAMLAATGPDAPQSLEATPGDGSVVLVWTAPADDGGSPVTEYEHRHAPGSSVPETTDWTSAGTALTVTVDGLDNGAEYAFEVRAVNGVGPGAAVAATAMLAATEPGAPQSLEATSGDGSVVLVWTAPADDGGSPVTEYEYRHAPGSSVPDTTGWTSGGTALTVTVDGLDNGAEYAFEVRAVNAVGPGAAVAATALLAATVPDAPQSLEATPGDGSVELVWTAPADDGGSAITRYDYRYAEGDSVPATTDWTSAGTALTVTVGGLDNGSEYAFEVRAVNGLGPGAAVAGTAVPDAVATVPDAPRNLSLTSGNAELVLKWDAPVSNGGEPVTGYEYRYAAGASVPETIVWTPVGAALTVTVDSLVNGTTYAFEVRAVNDVGPGAAVTGMGSPAATAPDAPQSLVATPGDGSVELVWTAPADDGGSPVTEYEYRHAPGSSVPDTTDWTSAGDVLTVTVDGLDSGAEYAFEVRAVNGVGPGAAIAGTALLAAAVPGAPQSLEATPGDGAVELIWTAPADDGGSPVTEYEYRHAPGSSVPDTTDWTSAGTALTVTVGGLDNGAEYAFEVRAVNGVGPGAAIAKTALLAAAVPDAPQSLVATPGDGSVELVWTAPADDGGSPITEYEYRHAAGSSVPAATDWTSAGTALTVTVGGLDNGAEYAFEVRAVNGVGPGAAIAKAALLAAAVPDAPRSLEATPGDGSVELVWTAPADDGGSPITRYDYRYAEGDSVPATTDWTSAGTALTVTVGGLDNGAEYAFEVRAVNDAGAGEPASTAATPVAAAGPPQSLEATPGDGSVELVWTAPADDGGSAITRYEYRYAAGAFVPDETGWTSVDLALTVTVDGLDNGAEYAFEVRAVNDVGPGDPASTTATPVTIPSPPRKLSATPGDGEVTISWEPPESDGGVPIVEYQYRYAEDSSVSDDTVWESAGTDLTRTVDGLADGQEHTFQVRAVNRVGPGALSEAAATVLELPILSVEDGQAEERSDPAIGFNVVLSRSSTREVSVDYATADRTARAGEDYERAEGTLVFAAGETEKTVSVPLLRDAKDEGEETFSFLLSNARNARIGRAEATGTVSNDRDALPGAWLVRFGRTIAQQVVDAVGARLEEEPRRHATVGGVSMLDATAGVGLETAYISAAERLQLPSDEQRARHSRGSGLPPGTSFHLSSSESGDGPVFSLWGRGAVDRFDAEVEDVRMDGDVTTGFLAADSDWGRMTLGAAVAHSQGQGMFAYTGPRASPQAHGEVRSAMVGVYPYARLRVDDTASLWGLVGAGAGHLTLREEGGAPIRTDTNLTLGALGAVKTLVAAPETDGFALSLKSDAFWVRTTSEAVRSLATGNLAASEGEATRLRLALEGERSFSDGEGRSFVPKLSIGVRHDGGDAETGLARISHRG